MAEAVSDWESDALCADLIRRDEADADWWHPATKGRTHEGTRRAVAVCRRCPVWQECRDYAARQGLTGVWGGIVHVTDKRKPMTHGRRSGRM